MLLSLGHLSSPSPSPSIPQTPATAAPSRKRGPFVLDEDAYIATIEHIIEGDFFPDICDRLTTWFEALCSRDPVLIRDSHLKTHDRRTSASIRSVTRTPAFSAFFSDRSATPTASDPPPSSPAQLPASPPPLTFARSHLFIVAVASCRPDPRPCYHCK